MESEASKNFNLSLKVYFIQKTEETANNLQRNLQVLMSLPASEFNPGKRETLELFKNLYELMLTIDTTNNIAWKSIDILLEACQNRSMRESLTHTFKFVPILTKLLDHKLVITKKLKILQLIQDLTYGIKISWQEAHLPRLISLTTKLITEDDSELVPLSLGILVNLCYNNSAAVYTLMRSVNIKNFLKTLLKVQKANTASKIQVCKLLFILEGISGGIPDTEIETYIRSTCPTLREAVSMSDSYLMRQVVDFFKKIIDNERAKKVVNNYLNYAEDVEALLNVVREMENLDRHCLAALFDYFSCLIGLNISGLEGLYQPFVVLALQWLRADDVSTDALRLISNIVTCLFHTQLENRNPEKVEILNEVHQLLDDHILIILALLDIKKDGTLLKGNGICSKFTALMSLITQMIGIKLFSKRMIALLDQQVFRKLFDPLLNAELEESVLFQQPVYTSYVEALSFVADLAKKEACWLLLYNDILQEKQIQTLLSVALYLGTDHIKKKVLSLTGTAGFLSENIDLLAKRMAELDKLIIFSPSNLSNKEQPMSLNSSYISPIDMMPILTVTLEGHLNSTLEKCEQMAQQKENTMTTAIMELYQYKMAVMNQTLRQLQSSQEVADERATRLQHNLLLTGCEVSRLHQLLYGAQQSLELATKETNSLSSQLGRVKQEAHETHRKYSEGLQSLRSKTVIISQLDVEIETYKSQLTSKEEMIIQLKEQLQQKTLECSQISNNLFGSRETIAVMKKNIASLEVLLDASKKEVLQQSLILNKYEKQITEKDKEISELSKELSEQHRMREIISELAMGKRKPDK